MDCDGIECEHTGVLAQTNCTHSNTLTLTHSLAHQVHSPTHSLYFLHAPQARNIRSGWKNIFFVFALASSDPKYGFRAVLDRPRALHLPLSISLTLSVQTLSWPVELMYHYVVRYLNRDVSVCVWVGGWGCVGVGELASMELETVFMAVRDRGIVSVCLCVCVYVCVSCVSRFT